VWLEGFRFWILSFIDMLFTWSVFFYAADIVSSTNKLYSSFLKNLSFQQPLLYCTLSVASLIFVSSHRVSDYTNIWNPNKKFVDLNGMSLRRSIPRHWCYSYWENRKHLYLPNNHLPPNFIHILQQKLKLIKILNCFYNLTFA